MEVYLIRHTKPEIKAGICYGQTDIGLARGFKNQAIKIKEHIPAGITIYTSPLMRCRLLAEAICDKSEPIADKRLMELDFGLWETKPWDEIDASEPWFKDFIYRQIPGGESYMDLFFRVNLFINELCDSRLKQAAVVTHGGVIKVINAINSNLPLDQAINQIIPFGSIQKLDFNAFCVEIETRQPQFVIGENKIFITKHLST